MSEIETVIAVIGSAVACVTAVLVSVRRAMQKVHDELAPTAKRLTGDELGVLLEAAVRLEEAIDSIDQKLTTAVTALPKSRAKRKDAGTAAASSAESDDPTAVIQ
jgi:hypothetical protein